jgi:hypothetical protein
MGKYFANQLIVMLTSGGQRLVIEPKAKQFCSKMEADMFREDFLTK